MTNPTLYTQMDTIMGRFDFTRVQKTMEALNWTWRGEPEAPSLKDLKNTAEDVMRMAVSGYKEGDPFHSVGTGGFTALILRYDAGPRLELMFNAERRTGD
jgi:hypothetical protein